jgi:Resolvase, N terminal domain
VLASVGMEADAKIRILGSAWHAPVESARVSQAAFLRQAVADLLKKVPEEAMLMSNQRAVIYFRMSTGEQGESPAQQEAACGTKAATLGVAVARVFTDEAMSGSRNDRPEYLHMLQAARASEFDMLLKDVSAAREFVRRLLVDGKIVLTPNEARTVISGGSTSSRWATMSSNLRDCGEK